MVDGENRYTHAPEVAANGVSRDESGAPAVAKKGRTPSSTQIRKRVLDGVPERSACDVRVLEKTVRINIRQDHVAREDVIIVVKKLR